MTSFLVILFVANGHLAVMKDWTPRSFEATACEDRARFAALYLSNHHPELPLHSVSCVKAHDAKTAIKIASHLGKKL